MEYYYMRPRAKPPLNRRYFHMQPKIDRRDMTILKKRIEIINQKRHKKQLEDKDKKRQWHI